jgi:hypothetical protein
MVYQFNMDYIEMSKWNKLKIINIYLIAEYLEFLNKNVIPHSCSKKAVTAIKNKDLPIKDRSTV